MSYWAKFNAEQASPAWWFRASDTRGRLNDAARQFAIGWGLLLARKEGV